MNFQGRMGLFKDLQVRLREQPWIAEINPGTKAHAWHLARMKNVRPWSLYNKLDGSTPLVPDKEEIHPYAHAPIATQASVIGGKLNQEGITRRELEQKKTFLRNMAAVVAGRAGKSGCFPIKEWKPGRVIAVPDDKNSYMKCLEIDHDKERIRFEACLKGTCGARLDS